MSNTKKYYVSLEKLAKYDELLKAKIAADDLANLNAAKAYADGLASNYDAAGAAATAESNAKTYAEGQVADLANGQVKTNKEAIAAIKDGTTIDSFADVEAALNGKQAAGDYATKTEAQGYANAKDEAIAAAKAAGDAAKDVADANALAIEAINNADTGILAQAKKFASDEDANVQGNVDALAGKVGEVPEGSTVMGIIDGIQKSAYNDTEIRNLIAGLDSNKADKDQVATDIAAAVKVETDARGEAVKAVQDAVDALSGTHATDKKALEDAIALKADQTALDGVSAVANAAATQTALADEVKAREDEIARVEGLITAEAERAAGVEEDFETRIAEMETFWDAADDPEGTIDKLAEIVNYIAADQSGALDMAGDIKKNTDAIAAMDEAYKAADGTLQENIDKKADASAVEELSGKVTALEEAADDYALKTELKEVSDALTEYETAHAGDYTNGQVDSAISTAISNEGTRVQGLLDGKVDKVEGKGLSTNDLTDELKGQYDDAYEHAMAAHAPVDAQANVIESVKVNGTALTVTGKAVDITVPTDNASLTNGAGYLVAADIANKADKATTLAGYGITDAYTTAQVDAAVEAAKKAALDADAVVLAEAQKAATAVQTNLDTHTGNGDIHVTADQKTEWTTAAGKAHEHGNLTVLEGITAEKVTAWDAAEGNAKAHADGLNTDMNARVEALETWHNNFYECSEEDIAGLFATAAN